MSRKEYRRVSEDDKVKALKRHLLEQVPVSTLCEELGVAPSLFYRWQQQLFEQAALWFGQRGKQQGASVQGSRLAVLEGRLRQREEALAELMAEYVALKKKANGEV